MRPATLWDFDYRLPRLGTGIVVPVNIRVIALLRKIFLRSCSCVLRWPSEANWPANSAVRGASTLRRGEKSRRRNRSEDEITAVPMGRYSYVP
jgi:hypothetical protein